MGIHSFSAFRPCCVLRAASFMNWPLNYRGNLYATQRREQNLIESFYLIVYSYVVAVPSSQSYSYICGRISHLAFSAAAPVCAMWTFGPTKDRRGDRAVETMNSTREVGSAYADWKSTTSSLSSSPASRSGRPPVPPPSPLPICRPQRTKTSKAALSATSPTISAPSWFVSFVSAFFV